MHTSAMRRAYGDRIPPAVWSLSIVALLVALAACTDPASEPEPDRTELTGVFITPEREHPLLAVALDSSAGVQMYFRPDDAPDEEWIAIVPETLVDRAELGARVRVTGRTVPVDLGGAEGTRAAYRGTKLLVVDVRQPEGS